MSWLTYTRGTIPTYRASLFLQGLKDGDSVEVDADRGIVKIIKKAKK